MVSKTLDELRENAAKAIEVCWAVERRDLGATKYLSWDPCTEDGMVWVDEWLRAIKLYDRASAEMLCAEMPDEWDVRILDHQLVFSTTEVEVDEVTTEQRKVGSYLAKWGKHSGGNWNWIVLCPPLRGVYGSGTAPTRAEARRQAVEAAAVLAG